MKHVDEEDMLVDESISSIDSTVACPKCNKYKAAFKEVQYAQQMNQRLFSSTASTVIGNGDKTNSPTNYNVPP
eukprot:CAMPEP_0168532376 /NCGR_PEP_ID=MMETSP0405-20121227/16188_1 /TAXON_ID=498012 /ORGANISM="Trichosphaerium sp, Strain Am-I-7 wt" /LENGTH=72 /DNA_ID=CAMNT_0008557721 /DNA_START=127 /DNA_END=343 /DNA_ORIENTATION=+